MKKLFLIGSLAFFLAACGALNVGYYDANEYGLVTKIRATAISSKEICNWSPITGTDAAWPLLPQARLLELYTQYSVDNELTHEMAIELKSLVDELAQHEVMSKFFCIEKLTNIEKAAEHIQQAIAKKER